MELKIFFCFVCLITVLQPPSSDAGLFSVVESGWKKFWQFSCTYSSVLPRSKRSLLDPLPEDLTDPDQVFAFLYPSANLTRESLTFQGRSADFGQQRSLTSWMSHITDVWHSECFQKYQKPTSRNEDGDPGEFQEATTTEPNRTTLAASSEIFYNASTLPPTNATGSSFSANHTIKYTKDPRTGAIIQAIVDSTPPTLSKQQDLFFGVYGGDIEYFFPLISFGIPFDGEITFIGFHGFKGLFPY